MTIDTSRAVEIEASPVKLLGLAMLGVMMTALSAAIALRAFPRIQPGSFAEFCGYAGAVFFGACTLLALWRAFTSHGPVVTITREGIRDSRIATDLIPWSAVNDITIWKQHRQRFIVLAVDPAVEAGLNLTRMARWTRNANRSLGADGLCLGTNDLKIGFDEMLATTIAFAEASQSQRR
jgi:hypothetical protein